MLAAFTAYDPDNMVKSVLYCSALVTFRAWVCWYKETDGVNPRSQLVGMWPGKELESHPKCSHRLSLHVPHMKPTSQLLLSEPLALLGYSQYRQYIRWQERYGSLLESMTRGPHQGLWRTLGLARIPNLLAELL